MNFLIYLIQAFASTRGLFFCRISDLDAKSWSLLRKKGSHVVVGKGIERETIPMHKELKIENIFGAYQKRVG